MKTRNAFWLRNFDAERILQRRYFKDFQFGEKPDAEILADLLVNDDEDIQSMEEKVSTLRLLQKRIYALKKRIDRHIARYEKVAAQIKAKHNLPDKDEILLTPAEYSHLANLLFKMWKKVSDIFYKTENATRKKYRDNLIDRLKYYQKKSGINRKKLGEMIGVLPQSMYDYWHGRRDVPIYTLIRLAKVLNISGDELLGL